MSFIFLLLLVGVMFLALVLQHFLGPLPLIGCRILLMQIVMLYGAISLPLPGMLLVTMAGGLMWDLLHASFLGEGYEVSIGWSMVLYVVLGTIMGGFRPLFRRGRWEIHCLLTGVLITLMVLAEYIMITLRREPVQFVFDRGIGWRIGGAGLAATLLSPLFFFVLNYLAVLIGYDPQPDRNIRKTKR
jgi:hypothetical protein